MILLSITLTEAHTPHLAFYDCCIFKVKTMIAIAEIEIAVLANISAKK